MSVSGVIMGYFNNETGSDSIPPNVGFVGNSGPFYNSLAVLKDNVLNAFSDIYQLNKTLDTETSHTKQAQDLLVKYLLDINPHMFFSVENIEHLANMINNNEEYRSLVFNLTDIALLHTVAENIDYINEIVFKVVQALDLTKVTDSSKVIYDTRLITGSCLNREDLLELITNNPFITVLYLLAISKVALLKIVTEI